MSENRCIMCNEHIPEGRLICPICEINMNNNAYNPKTLARDKYKKRKSKALQESKKPKFYDEDFDF